MMFFRKVGQCFQPVCHTLVSNARNLFVHYVTFCGQSISVVQFFSIWNLCALCVLSRLIHPSPPIIEPRSRGPPCSEPLSSVW